jgi:hypothetical protein
MADAVRCSGCMPGVQFSAQQGFSVWYHAKLDLAAA